MHFLGSAKDSEISLDQRGIQRYLWINEGFRDIFGPALAELCFTMEFGFQGN